MSHPSGLEYEVPGSRRKPIPGAEVLGELDLNEPIQITVQVRGRAPLPAPDLLGAQLPRDREYLSLARLEEEFGADPDCLAKVLEYARERGFSAEPLPGARLVTLRGSVGQLQEAFGVELERYFTPAGQFCRGREGSVWAPCRLEGAITAVFGLDDRPQAVFPHGEMPGSGAPRFVNAADLARIYEFPTDSDGEGETVAVLEFESGFLATDLDAHFGKLLAPRPEVVPVTVYGGRILASGRAEPMLSVTILGGAAPGARQVLYFAPNDDGGIIQAFAAAIHDRVHAPSVISMSWGALEMDTTEQYQSALEDLLRAAALLGITVCAAPGNRGSSMGEPEGAHVTYPASSPYVLACGGSEILDLDEAPRREVVWNDGAGGATGGGVSQFFVDTPAWQVGGQVRLHADQPGSSGRHLPDVAAHAPDYGFLLTGSTEPSRMGGTSASAPLWAALIARLNGALGTRVGFLNPLLYAPEAAGVLHDIVEGSNGAYSARPGWDACSGHGSPHGARLLRYLRTGCVD